MLHVRTPRRQFVGPSRLVATNNEVLDLSLCNLVRKQIVIIFTNHGPTENVVFKSSAEDAATIQNLNLIPERKTKKKKNYKFDSKNPTYVYFFFKYVSNNVFTNNSKATFMLLIDKPTEICAVRTEIL